MNAEARSKGVRIDKFSVHDAIFVREFLDCERFVRTLTSIETKQRGNLPPGVADIESTLSNLDGQDFFGWHADVVQLFFAAA